MFHWLRNFLGVSKHGQVASSSNKRMTVKDILFVQQAAGKDYLNDGYSAVFTDGADIDVFLDSYLENPRPKWIMPMLEFLTEQPDIPQPSIAGLTGFLSEAIRDNPDLESKWNSQVTYGCPGLRTLYSTARSLNRQKILSSQASAELNDLIWGAFRASRNQEYIEKLIDHLRFIDTYETKPQLAAGASAKWSLAAHVQSFPYIRECLESALNKRDGKIRVHLEEVLTQEMSTIEKEIHDLFSKGQS